MAEIDYRICLIPAPYPYLHISSLAIEIMALSVVQDSDLESLYMTAKRLDHAPSVWSNNSKQRVPPT
jgi:hypothetical protein